MRGECLLLHRALMIWRNRSKMLCKHYEQDQDHIRPNGAKEEICRNAYMVHLSIIILNTKSLMSLSHGHITIMTQVCPAVIPNLCL